MHHRARIHNAGTPRNNREMFYSCRDHLPFSNAPRLQSQLLRRAVVGARELAIQVAQFLERHADTATSSAAI